MKYENNKIVYEVGDYVIVSEHKDTPCRYFRDDTLCKCAEKNYYSPLDKSSIVSDWGGTERFNVTNRGGNDRQLRPATQEEINKATEEIKPREWWVNLYNIGEGGIFKTKEAANTVASSGRTEIIKVREVLE